MTHTSPAHGTAVPTWMYALAIGVPALVVAAVMLQPWVAPDDLFRDPLAVAHDAAERGECCHLYFGLLSNLGVLLWCSSAAVCLLAGFTLRGRPSQGRASLFLLSAGALNLILLVDDLLQAHEYVYPAVFGVTEKPVIAVYGLLLLLYLLGNRALIRRAGAPLLLLALAFFAASVLSDAVLPHESPFYRVGDDGTKLIGLFLWTAFHLRAAWMLLSAEEAAPALS